MAPLSTQTTTQYIYNNQTATALVAAKPGNGNLKWESTTGTNVGNRFLPFSITGSRETVEGYHTKTSKPFITPAAADHDGVMVPYCRNIGKLQK